MKVWIVSYSDRSGIAGVFENEKMADFYMEAACGGIKEEFETVTLTRFDE